MKTVQQKQLDLLAEEIKALHSYCLNYQAGQIPPVDPIQEIRVQGAKQAYQSLARELERLYKIASA